VRPILRADMAKASGLAPAELMDALVLHLLLTETKAPTNPLPHRALVRGVQARRAEAAARWESLTGPVATSRAPHVVESLVRSYAAGLGIPPS